MNNYACIVNVKNNIENPKTVIINGDNECREQHSNDDAEYAEYEEVNDDEEDRQTEIGDETEEIVARLAPIFYGSSDNARAFLDDIRTLTPVEVCKKVRILVRDKVISDISCRKDLWQILHDNNLYKPTLRNWTKQMW